MQTRDDFGHDPTVRRTRHYFSRMETMDSQLLKRSGISVFDPRLRRGRDMRFRLFETCCSLAAKKRLSLDETLALELFTLCQDTAFKTSGLPVASREGTENPALLSLIKEALK